MRLPEWYRKNVPCLIAIRGVRSFSQSLLVIAVPVWGATVASAINTVLWGYFFRNVKPPEEQ